MSLIEQATKRLEQLERAGVHVPWAAAGKTLAVHPLQSEEAEHTSATQFEVIEEPTLSLVTPAARRPKPISLQTAMHAASSRVEPRTQVMLDLEALRSAGYLVPDQVRSEMAQQFRQLKRPLLKNARAASHVADHRGTLIMVTSALPGEGKTFCSINLAMSMAMEIDTAVILIDADVVQPSLFSRLGVTTASAPGLLDLLTRENLELHDALVSTNVPKLTLMSAGNRDDRSTELLSSESMDRLLSELTETYADHVIIFDAPPVLLTTESSALASKVGQVVVVVEASKTPRSSVQQVFLALNHCSVVMSVLNKCEPENNRYGYHYG
jgi:protein-tyrosine kinase